MERYHQKKKRPLKYTACNTKNKYGVKLLVDGKPNVYPISFLMATTFIENPNKYTLIRYKDNNIENYDVNNLEWTDNPYMSTNTWDVLKNYPNYEICKQGEIRNIKTKKVLSSHTTPGSYPSTDLTDINKVSKPVYIHVLLAKQYIENPFNLPEVNHIDGNRMNYVIDNLEWVTHKQNCQHAFDTGLNKGHKNKGRHVELLDENYQVINTFTSKQKACDFMDINLCVLQYYLNKNIFGDGTALIKGYTVRLKIIHDLEGEIWKPVNTEHKYIDTHYEVSSHARVRHINNRCILVGMMRGDYHRVSLSCGVGDTKDKIFLVHRLVAFAFYPYEGNQSNYDVDHINKNPSHNYVDNLAIMKRRDHLVFQCWV